MAADGSRDPAAGRVPPNDLDAEAAVLSTVMLKPGAIDELAGLLKPEDFYSDANRRIFDACRALSADGQPIDLVQVCGYLRDRERLAHVGGAAYVASIVDATPSVANVQHHAAIVVRKARLRRVIAEAQRIYAEGYGDVGDVDEWLEGVDSRLTAAARTAEVTSLHSMGDVLRDVWTEINDVLDPNKPKPPGAKTGLRDLDEIIGPLRPGRHSVIGGFWADGKTSLGFQCAISTASERKTTATGPEYPNGVLVISIEMGRDELAQRGLFLHARVDGGKAKPARLGQITEVEWRELAQSGASLSRLPIYFDDRPDMNPELIRSTIRRHKAELARQGRTLRLVMVDYLQLVEGGASVRKNGNREQEVAVVARALKRISKAENVHVMALAQLNDDPNKRGKDERKPTSRDFRESKAIPMNADAVILIHNPKARERAKSIIATGTAPPAHEGETVELIVDKLRGGRTGTARAVFWPHLTMFADFDGRER